VPVGHPPGGSATVLAAVPEQKTLQMLASFCHHLPTNTAQPNEIAHRLVIGVPAHTDVSSPARKRRASIAASRRLVFTSSPDLRGISDGATTSQAEQARAKLFQMLLNDTSRRKAALSILGQVEVWRNVAAHRASRAIRLSNPTNHGGDFISSNKRNLGECHQTIRPVPATHSDIGC
jgi:hypothetical protein